MLERKESAIPTYTRTNSDEPAVRGSRISWWWAEGAASAGGGQRESRGLSHMAVVGLQWGLGCIAVVGLQWGLGRIIRTECLLIKRAAQPPTKKTTRR